MGTIIGKLCLTQHLEEEEIKLLHIALYQTEIKEINDQN